eukprot:6196758-Pleurochrysis_carterae.AAC.1
MRLWQPPVRRAVHIHDGRRGESTKSAGKESFGEAMRTSRQRAEQILVDVDQRQLKRDALLSATHIRSARPRLCGAELDPNTWHVCYGKASYWPVLRQSYYRSGTKRDPNHYGWTLPRLNRTSTTMLSLPPWSSSSSPLPSSLRSLVFAMAITTIVAVTHAGIEM